MRHSKLPHGADDYSDDHRHPSRYPGLNLLRPLGTLLVLSESRSDGGLQHYWEGGIHQPGGTAPLSV